MDNVNKNQAMRCAATVGTLTGTIGSQHGVAPAEQRGDLMERWADPVVSRPRQSGEHAWEMNHLKDRGYPRVDAATAVAGAAAAAAAAAAAQICTEVGTYRRSRGAEEAEPEESKAPGALIDQRGLALILWPERVHCM